MQTAIAAPASRMPSSFFRSENFLVINILPTLLLGAHAGNDWCEWDLLRSRRQIWREHRLGDARREIPIGEHRGELRLAGLSLVGNDQLAGRQLWSRVDPDLPVDILLYEREGVTASAVHVVETQIDPILQLPANALVRVVVQEIRQRRGEVDLRKQLAQHCVDIRCRRRGRIERRGRIVQRDRLAVVPELPLAEIALPLDVKPAWPLQGDRS